MRFGIYYFSGCGNTSWVAQRTIEALERRGHEVAFCHNLETALPMDLPKTDIDMFLSPIYYAGVPSLVVEKLKLMPITGNKKAVFWTVAGQFSGIGRRFGSFLLKDRGYNVMTTLLIRMPDTYLPLSISQVSEEQKQLIFQKAIDQIDMGLNEIDHNTTSPGEKKRTAILSALLYFPYLYYLRYVLSYCFVSTSKCIHCGKCERDCPCQTIRIFKDRPSWHKNCTGCFRCVNTCPVSAIDISWIGIGFGVFGAVCCWLLATVCFSFLGSVLSFLLEWGAFFAGFWLGTWIFQKIYLYLPIEKYLMMKGKKRIFVADGKK